MINQVKNPIAIEIIKYWFEKSEEEANINELKKSKYKELIIKQTLNKLDKIGKGKNEKIKKWINNVEGFVRECKLDIKDKRKLRGIIRQKHGLEDKEIIQEIEDLVRDCEKEKYQPPKKKYAEVIVSESLK